MKTKSNTQVFHRLIKAQHGHPFAGLYAVEMVCFQGDDLVEREIVHEWDLRIIAEAKLAQLGGIAAYKAFKMDNELAMVPTAPNTAEAGARLPEQVKLTKNKLTREMKLKPEGE